MATVIRVSAVLAHDDRGRVLTVRKRGTSMYMFPGGKPEPGETPLATAVREFAEELGVHLDPARFTDLGVHREAAANEPGHVVEGAVFRYDDPVQVTGVAAEIEDLRWIPARPPFADDVAPLAQKILHQEAGA